MSDEHIHSATEEKSGVSQKSESSDGAREESHTVTAYFLIKFLHTSETQLCFTSSEDGYRRGDHVIAQSRYGKDIAEVLGPVNHPENHDGEEAIEVDREVTEEDWQTYRENLAREEEALEICREKVNKHGLSMKLVSAHYLIGERKILFFFTADSRVDFRELVKDLVSVFKIRIELRQIGVRDESRVLGGLAVCGRKYCCHSLTDKLNPVSIKMAKEQNLSLNSMKISGPCGRLLCCLSYEYDFYKEEKRRLPSEGNRLYVGKEEFRVSDVNILTKRVTLTSYDGRSLETPFSRLTWNEERKKWELLPEESES
jgi:cell fate regulator YaaT (PSP1 superfamily)